MADVRIVGQGTPGILAAADQAYGFGGEKNLFAVPVIFAAQDGEGDFFFAKHLVELAALLGRDMHLYFGITVCVVLEDCREAVVGVVQGTAEPQCAADVVLAGGGEFFHLLHIFEDRVGAWQQTFGSRGEKDAPLGADEQRTVQFFFHFLNTLGDGWLCHIEGLCRLCYIFVLVECQQQFIITFIHIELLIIPNRYES